MSSLLLLNQRFLETMLLWQKGLSLLEGVWKFLTTRFVDSPTMKVSTFRLIVGIAMLVAVLVFSGRLSSVLDRRIAKRTHIDAGLRYTIARLLRYLVLVIGIVAVLKGAFELDLTSIAVVFTALSGGIGSRLPYSAAGIGSGFILVFGRAVGVGDRISVGEVEGDVQSIR